MGDRERASPGHASSRLPAGGNPATRAQTHIIESQPGDEDSVMSTHLRRHISKEVRVMAEAIAMLVVGGLVVTVSVGVAYLVIYLFGNNGTH
jgi:hypothetical protein